MNPAACEYFEHNPDAKYWYASGTIRIINPEVWRDPLYRPDPWPNKRHEC